MNGKTMIDRMSALMEEFNKHEARLFGEFLENSGIVPVKKEDFKDVAYCAFRYALGRKTYISKSIAEFLIAHKDDLSEGAQKGIMVEIEMAIADGEAGAQMDIDSWKQVVAKFEEE